MHYFSVKTLPETPFPPSLMKKGYGARSLVESDPESPLGWYLRGLARLLLVGGPGFPAVQSAGPPDRLRWRAEKSSGADC